MKDEIMQNLIGVLNALNNISVRGKTNLANLSGSIAVIERVAGMLEDSDIIPNSTEEKKK